MIKYLKNKPGFTLLELLIVIGILAILSTTVLIVINPVNLLMKARDSRRVSELNSLNKAINVFIVSLPNGSLGSSQTVYTSLPDTNSDCSSYSLPNLPTGWVYHCVTETNLRKVDSNGWIPINFTLLDTGSPISHLPIDPINNSSLYYTYTTGGSFELTSLLENPDHHDPAINDGGPCPGVYEIGTHLGLTPSTRDLGLVGYWKLDEGTGTTANDYSVNSNTGTLTNGPTWTDSGKVNKALSFDGTDDYVNVPHHISLKPTGAITVEGWGYRSSWASVPDERIAACTEAGGYTLGVNIDEKDGITALRRNNTYGWVYYDISGLAGGWHHFVMTYDGRYLKAFIDGSQVGSTNDAGDTYPIDYTYDNSLLIGAEAGSGDIPTGDYFNGIMDEVRIYNRALSAQEIQARYSATK
jgi:prepilin-type N-terminal cleavage/methylation domain-containing protein